MPIDDREYAISLDDFIGLPSQIVNLHCKLTDLITPIGIQASIEPGGGIFGRDSLRVGLDLVPWFPHLIEEILISLAWLQGDCTDDRSEEEPGKIPHEYRPSRIGRRALSREQIRSLEKLRQLWKNEKNIVYYGSVDATPQFLRLVSEAVQFHGPGLLNVSFVHKSGDIRTLRDSALHAANWIEGAIRRSDLTLLEFQRRNPNGHRYQVLRDGVTSYIHAESGDLANPDQPIASLEVQALAVDALRTAAVLLGGDHPRLADQWRQLATAVSVQTFKWFWLPDDEFFAMAIDRNSAGKARRVRTRSSLSAEMLETSIFDELPGPERTEYVRAIINEMLGPEFLTQAGIRCLARSYQNLLPYWDFQGALSTWTTITDSFARGLRRQGFLRAAIDQENRFLNALNMTGNFVEFSYVDAEGHIDYDPYQRRATRMDTRVIPSKDVPNPNQAWTISAALRAVLSRATPTIVNEPADCLNKAVPFSCAAAMKYPVPLLRTKEEVLDAYPTDYAFRIDQDEGMSLLREHWRLRDVRLYHHDDPANAE